MKRTTTKKRKTYHLQLNLDDPKIPAVANAVAEIECSKTVYPFKFHLILPRIWELPFDEPVERESRH